MCSNENYGLNTYEVVDFNFLLHLGGFKLPFPSIPVTDALEGELGEEELVIQILTFVA